MNERNKTLDLLASAIKQSLTNIYGKEVGFALFMFEFGSDTAGDYVSNAKNNTKSVVYDPKDVAKTTIKETVLLENYVSNAGNNRSIVAIM